MNLLRQGNLYYANLMHLPGNATNAKAAAEAKRTGI
jgi:hypothetical protein